MTATAEKVPPIIAKEVAAQEAKRIAPVKPRSRLKAVDPTTAEPSRAKVLIYGKPGVGKTWTSLDFPKPYYIDTESGADLAHYTAKLKAAGGAYFGVDQGSLDFKELIEQVKALATEEHEYKTLVIDSISKIFNTTIAAEAERLGDKDQYGASKKLPVSYTRQLINWIDRLDMSVVLIAHEKPMWGMDAKGQRSEIGVTFDAYEKLEYELNLCLNITKQGDSRYATVRKSRLLGFPDAMRFDWSYSKFAEIYGKNIIEKKSEAIKLATDEQVKEFTSLLETLKTEDGWLEKCLTKAKASKIEELSESQISAMIKSLNERTKK